MAFKLSDGAWGALTGGLSAGLSFLGGSLSSGKQYRYQRQLMEHQYNLTRQLNRNAYQDTTYSMRQAGINPMLAISNGINGLSAGSGGSVNVPAPDNPVNSALNYLQYKREKKLADSTVDVNKTTARMNDYLGDKAHHESAYAREQTQLLQDYGPMLKQQEYLNALANTAKVYQDIANSKAITMAQIRNINTNSAKQAKETKAISRAKQEGLSKWQLQTGKFGTWGLQEYEYDF